MKIRRQIIFGKLPGIVQHALKVNGHRKSPNTRFSCSFHSEAMIQSSCSHTALNRQSNTYTMLPNLLCSTHADTYPSPQSKKR
ncbi:hypothetical protein FGIG_10639 [Fasciola gigantica]|uniref:Uncharacterized protein n=1 Tax=Fasciola gigantica TaxID=46835 RepID=A0A504Y8P9_FASGI|nr:hypothetical protein FGIG_10639 [Fasciola gigantica]